MRSTSLAVLDDQPRDMFSPRKRHVLKELAAVVMREMELWRDKVRCACPPCFYTHVILTDCSRFNYVFEIASRIP